MSNKLPDQSAGAIVLILITAAFLTCFSILMMYSEPTTVEDAKHSVPGIIHNNVVCTFEDGRTLSFTAVTTWREGDTLHIKEPSGTIVVDDVKRICKFR